MTLAAFASAVLALLLAPGPTNTLMCVAGAEGGMRRVVRFIPAELSGYLLTILPLAWLGAELLARWPALAVGLKLVAACWVMVLAVRLWGRAAGAEGGGQVSARRIWLTTLLNPKALVFGLVLLPHPGAAAFWPQLGLFCLLVAAVALVWGAAGRLTQSGGNGLERLHLVQRAASVWLTVVAVTLVAGVISA